MQVELTEKQIESLHGSAYKSFFCEHSDMFEGDHTNRSLANKTQLLRLQSVIKEFPDKDCMLFFYENHLEALFAYNYYRKSNKCLLLWNLAENPDPQWCILINNPDLRKKIFD